MSRQFIEAQHNSSYLSKAKEQEAQLRYFTTSSLQETFLTKDYIERWASSKYQTNDYFLNWIKVIFKEENFLVFTKYLRNPIPSAKIVHNRIEPQLRRVFNSEDSDFKYSVNNAELSEFLPKLNIEEFNEELFLRLLYKHNSIVVSQLTGGQENEAYRYFVDIEKIVSLELSGNKIERIAFLSSVEIDEKIIHGYVYIDNQAYKFYDKDYNELLNEVNELSYVPAHFISDKDFDFNPVIKESLFTFIREELEEYVFIKTLQKMTEPNGAIPVITKIEVNEESESDSGTDTIAPSSDLIMGSQIAKINEQNNNSGSGVVQPGTVHEVPLDAITTDEGKIDVAAVEKFLNFFYLPVDILNYINIRTKELENSIVKTIVGDLLESSEASKNELQIEKSISGLENTLNSLSTTIGRTRKLSDKDMLALIYGENSIEEVYVNIGTDFFLESQTSLLEQFEKAPNTLERKNIIVKLNRNKYKNNYEQSSRMQLLYELIPFVSDKDFEAAKGTASVDIITQSYQVRFNYWISQFEALYGDIVQFYNNLDSDKAQKLLLINNLIVQIITKNTKVDENSNSLESGEGNGSEA